jgi:cytochrome c oxidase assembly factor CtaG
MSDNRNRLKNFATSIPWSTVIWIADLSSKLLQWAFSMNVFDLASDSINQVAGALEHTVYHPFLLSFLVLVGAYLVWQGVIRRQKTLVRKTSV